MEKTHPIETTLTLIEEYRSFEEFNEWNEEQILEVDAFLKQYADLVYRSFLGSEKEEAKVVPMSNSQITKAA